MSESDPAAGRYGVILADPPWSYMNWTDAAHGAAHSAMTTMTPEDIAAVPVESWAAPQSVLAMWATWPKLDEAIALMGAWGFRYVTGVPWIKTLPGEQAGLFDASEGVVWVRRGIGFWFQSTSEMVLFGVRGDCSPGRTAQLGLLCGSERQFYAERAARHSEKPEGIACYLERHFDGPYLELFARQQRSAWACWGYETGYELGAWGVRPVGLEKE